MTFSQKYIIINTEIDTNYDKDRRILGLGFGEYKEKYERFTRIDPNEEELNSTENYLYAHRDMIKQLVAQGKSKDMQDAEERVTQFVNKVCTSGEVLDKDMLKNAIIHMQADYVFAPRDILPDNDFLTLLLNCEEHVLMRVEIAQ